MLDSSQLLLGGLSQILPPGSSNRSLTLVEVIVAFDDRAANIAEQRSARCASHLIAPGFLDTSLGALGTLSDQSVTHGFLDGMPFVKNNVLGGYQWF